MTAVRIRRATVADGAAVAGIYAPYVLGPGVSFELTPPDGAAMAGRIAATIASHPWLMAEVDGTPVAYAYAQAYSARPAYRWTVSTTIYVGTAHRGQGVGRVLYPALLAISRAQGFRSALAELALPNPGSARLHAQCGFSHIGALPDAGYKHGVWYPIDFWFCRLNPADPPGEPVPFPALPEIATLLAT